MSEKVKNGLYIFLKPIEIPQFTVYNAESMASLLNKPLNQLSNSQSTNLSSTKFYITVLIYYDAAHFPYGW